MDNSSKENTFVRMNYKNITHHHCCVPMCNSDGRYDPFVSFHTFPKDEHLKKQWIHKIRRDPGKLFNISKSTVVCSEHFKNEDFRGWTPCHIKRLKQGSIPTVFPWTEEKTPRRSIKRRVHTYVGRRSAKRLRQEDAEETNKDEDEGAVKTEQIQK